MTFQRSLVVVVALSLLSVPLTAQPGRGRNLVEERFKSSRLEPPEGVDQGKFFKMRNGNVSLENPTPEEIKLLEDVAKQAIYPITHFELYTPPDPRGAELAPRSEDKTVERQLSELRGRLVVITPGDTTIPQPKLDYAREFGKAAVKVIDEVLSKTQLPIVRGNAIRMLAVVAESGAPAATERIVRLLQQKDDPAMPVEVLYYGLKAAENAIASYDPSRALVARQKWVSRESHFTLVKLVNEIVRKMPGVVAGKTYLPDRSSPGALATTPATPPKADPQALTPEQIATVQMFRLQAVRALARVKTDVVFNDGRDKQIRPIVTLAQVAISDPAISPAPNFREVGEAILGMVNAQPTSDDLNGDVLGLAIASGISTFVTDKAVGDRTGGGGPQVAHWKLYGTKMKVAFQEWDTNTLGKGVRPDKTQRDSLRELAQLAVTNVFDPLSKQSDMGVVTGLKKEAIDEWLVKKGATIKSTELFDGLSETKLTFGR